jgi:septal ring factor EnvC (AmiA/AmiB activator)
MVFLLILMFHKEIHELKDTIKTTKEIKEKMERLHHKEIADIKTQESYLEQTVTKLKKKISELNMYITTNNAPTVNTLDKR